MRQNQKTVLKKGDPFAQQLISDELNRLVDLYRENGYLKFSFEELAGVWDTLNLAILRPNVDPFDIVFDFVASANACSSLLLITWLIESILKR